MKNKFNFLLYLNNPMIIKMIQVPIFIYGWLDLFFKESAFNSYIYIFIFFKYLAIICFCMDICYFIFYIFYYKSFRSDKSIKNNKEKYLMFTSLIFLFLGIYFANVETYIWKLFILFSTLIFLYIFLKRMPSRWIYKFTEDFNFFTGGIVTTNDDSRNIHFKLWIIIACCILLLCIFGYLAWAIYSF